MTLNLKINAQKTVYFIKGNGLGLLNIPQWCTTHDFDLTKKVGGLLFSNADPVSHDNRWASPSKINLMSLQCVLV